MAKELKVNLKVSADTQAAKQSLENLTKSLDSLKKTSSNIISPTGLQQAQEAARSLETHLSKAVNTNTNKLDLSKFSLSLKSANEDLTTLSLKLLQGGQAGQQAFSALTQSISAADNVTVSLGKRFDELLTTLKNTARWQISSTILHGFMSTLQGAYTYAQKLNKSLTDIQIVTEASSDKMAQFAKEANKAAQALSTTTNTYAKAALIYYQQGLNDKQVKERTDLTIKMANVTGDTAKTVSEQLTAIWNNFDDGSRSLESYVDTITALGAATASSTTEIAEGLEKFASIATTVGLSYEYATAALATVTAKTRQSADVVGTAFKTLFARIQDLELGNTLDDGTTLGTYSQALKTIGVNIKDTNGELKDMDSILDEIGAKWDKIDRATQVAVAQAVGGTRQYNQFIAIMDNWDYMQENVGVAQNSSGTLQRQADIYAESWEAARDRVKAAAEEIYASILDDKFFISITNGFGKFLDVINNIVTSLGGMRTILIAVMGLLSQKIAASLPNVFAGLTEGAKNFTKKTIRSFNIQPSNKVNSALRSEQEKILTDNSKVAKDQYDKIKSNEFVSEERKGQAYVNSLQASLAQKINDSSRNWTKAEQERNLALQDQLKTLSEIYVKQCKIADKTKESAGQARQNVIDILNDEKQESWEAEHPGERYSKRSRGQNNRYSEETVEEFENTQRDITHIQGLKRTHTLSIDNFKIQLANIDTMPEETQKQLEAKNKAREGLRGTINKYYDSLENDRILGQNKNNASSKFGKAMQARHKNENMSTAELIKLGETDKNGSSILDTATNKLANLEEQIEDILNSVSDKVRKSLRTLREEVGKDEQAKDDTDRIGQQLEQPNEQVDEPIRKFSDTLSGVAETAIATASAISIVTGAINVLSDDSASAGEKIMSVVVAFSSLIPIIPTLANGVNTLAGAFVKGGLKTQLAWWEVTLIMLGIAAAVAALTIAIKALVNWYNKDKLAAEKAAKSAKELSEAYDKVKSAHEEMLQQISKYEEAEDALDKLTIGTKEYEEALKEANKQALSLIDKYKLIKDADYTITSDGRIIIKSSALREVSDESAQKVNRAEAASDYANLQAQQASDKALDTQLKRSIAGNQTTNGLLWGVGGGILTALSFLIPIAGPFIAAGIAAASTIGGMITSNNIAAKEAEYEAVIEALRSGDLSISNDMTYAEFSEKLAQLNIQDEKLIQALYDNKDSLDELIKSYNTNKELEDSWALQFARGVFSTDENLIASGALADLASIGKGLVLKTKEQVENDWKNIYSKNKNIIGYEYFNTYKDSLGDRASYLGNGKYRYYDENGDEKTEKISEDILKDFYIAQQGENVLTKNKAQIIEAYNITANNAAARSMLVNKNFENVNRQDFEKFLELSEKEKAIVLGAKNLSPEGLNTYAKEVLSEDSWQDALNTIYKEQEDTLKAWSSFDNSPIANLAKLASANQKNLQSFKNIIEEMKNSPLYDQNAKIISAGIEQLSGDSAEVLDALSQLDYSSYDIGRQVKNTLSALGKELTMSEEDFEAWVETVKQTSGVVPVFNDILTNLANIYDIIQDIDFGELISREDYETLIAYNNELKKMFQYVGNNKFRFNGDNEDLVKVIEEQMTQELMDLKGYIEASKALQSIDNLTSQMLMGSGANAETIEQRKKDINNAFSKTNEEGLSAWDIIRQQHPEYSAEWFEEVSSVDDINALLELFNKILTASERSVENMEQIAYYSETIASLNQKLKEGKIDQNAYDKQLAVLKRNIKDILDSAEDIVREIEYLNRLLSRQQQLTDILYGADKIASLEKEVMWLDKIIARTDEQIEAYRKVTLEKKKALAAKGAQFDSDGYFTNAYELYGTVLTADEINDYWDAWNNWIEAQDTKLSKQIEKLQKNYEKLTEALEQKLDLIDMDMTKLESHFSRIEDDVYKTAEAFNLLRKQQELTQDKLAAYEAHFNELQAARAADKITSADYAAGLKEIYDQIYDNIDAMYDFDQQMREYYSDTLSKINEEIEKYTKTFEHLAQITEHYKNIVTLVYGEEDYDRLEIIYEASLKNIENKLSVAEAEMRAAQEQYDWLMAQPNKLQEDVEAATTQLQEKTEAYFETLEEKIESVQALVENGLARAAAQLESTLTNGSTFERITQSMSMASKYNELFYTTTNKLYETQKRINNVTQELAKTTNKNYQNELKQWKTRLENAQKQETLSKNQLALMDAEFKIIQARAAFEEAQNAKSTVRLTRDSEGNYGYVFTADQDNIVKAQQNLLDAENELYNKQLEIANSNAEQLVQIQLEMFEKIKEINGDLTLSAEERELRIQEIYQQYSPYILALINDRNLAISYSEENTSKIMAEAWSSAYEDVIESCSKWESAYKVYTDECTVYMEQWQKVVEEVSEKTGLSFDKLKEHMSGIVSESDKIKTALIGENGLVDTLNDVAKQVLAQTTKYADFSSALGDVASKYEAIAAQARAALAAMQEVANFDSDASYEPLDSESSKYWEGTEDNDTGVKGHIGSEYDTDINAYLQSLGYTMDASKDTGGRGTAYTNDEGKTIVYSTGGGYLTMTEYTQKNKLGSQKKVHLSDIVTSTGQTIAEKFAADGFIVKEPAEGGDGDSETGNDFNSVSAAIQAGEEDGLFNEEDVAQLFDYSKNHSTTETLQKIQETIADKKRIQAQINKIEQERKSRPSFVKTGRQVQKDNTQTTTVHTVKWYNTEEELKEQILADPSGTKYLVWEDGYVPYNAASVSYNKGSGLWRVHVNAGTNIYNKTSSYDTGGYTGKWGPEGKLATLHEKELVLNKQDTSNILAAVSLIRQIASAIDLQALMQSFGLLSIGASKLGTIAHTSLEQKVEITAQFPNAIYHDEIKEAFDTLINRASQYANRNY